MKGRQPLFKPFAIGRQILNALGYQRLGLIAPIPAQEAPITARWQQAGFQPTVWTADVTCQDRSFYATLAEQVQAHALQVIVLDYVGHDLAHIQQLQRAVDLPVFDLGQLCVAALVGALD